MIGIASLMAMSLILNNGDKVVEFTDKQMTNIPSTKRIYISKEKRVHKLGDTEIQFGTKEQDGKIGLFFDKNKNGELDQDEKLCFVDDNFEVDYTVSGKKYKYRFHIDALFRQIYFSLAPQTAISGKLEGKEIIIVDSSADGIFDEHDLVNFGNGWALGARRIIFNDKLVSISNHNGGRTWKLTSEDVTFRKAQIITSDPNVKVSWLLKHKELQTTTKLSSNSISSLPVGTYSIIDSSFTVKSKDTKSGKDFNVSFRRFKKSEKEITIGKCDNDSQLEFKFELPNKLEFTATKNNNNGGYIVSDPNFVGTNGERYSPFPSGSPTHMLVKNLPKVFGVTEDKQEVHIANLSYG